MYETNNNNSKSDTSFNKVQQPKINNKLSSWIRIIPLIIGLYLILLTYNYFYRGGFIDATWSESLAGAGGILIGMSFALSSVSYFFDFGDKYLRYRKELGIYGYLFALFYSFSLQYRFPDRYFNGLGANLFEIEVMLGLSAMAILTFMALISNQYGMSWLGPNWRRSLRFGYLAYLFLIIRAFIVEGEVWSDWLINPSILAPPRMLLTIYASLIIVARILMEISLRKNK